MPLLSKRPVGDGFLALWLRDESTSQLLERIVLSPAEQSFYDKIAHQARRRKEWLTWHVMLRELLGEGIESGYDPAGTPILLNHPGHISVSHGGDYVALYYQPGRCGLDIEDCARGFDRVARRFISSRELQLLEGEPDHRFMALMWCAKEAVYKYAGIAGLDFLRDMQAESIDPGSSTLRIRLQEGETVLLRYEFIKGHCMAYTIK